MCIEKGPTNFWLTSNDPRMHLEYRNRRGTHMEYFGSRWFFKTNNYTLISASDHTSRQKPWLQASLLSPSLLLWFSHQSMAMYCAIAWVHQCMGSQISRKSNKPQYINTKKYTVYNHKVNSKRVGSVTGSDNVVVTVFYVHSLPINAQLYTSRNNNFQPAGTVPCVFCRIKCNSCKPMW